MTPGERADSSQTIPIPDVACVVQVAREAGRRIEHVRRSGFTVAEKAPQDPVTEADHVADAYLRTALLDLAPVAWLSEETADDPRRLGARALWVVDPLDGTREFVEGVPQYSVAIGLVVDGVTELGVVHNPASGETAWARRGNGCWFDGERCRVGGGSDLLASRSELRRGEFEPFQDEWSIRAVGSIQYKLALIAAGRAAATLSRGPKHEWDVCAGALLVTEAGGVATDMFGGTLAYNQAFPKVKGIIAGFPTAVALLRSALVSHGPSARMAEFGGELQ